MQTRDVRGQKMPKNANVTCESSLRGTVLSCCLFCKYNEYLVIMSHLLWLINDRKHCSNSGSKFASSSLLAKIAWTLFIRFTEIFEKNTKNGNAHSKMISPQYVYQGSFSQDYCVTFHLPKLKENLWHQFPILSVCKPINAL